MSKLISIIIPCYNAEAYIDRCFQSVAAQTIGMENLEIILVDDCSTDSTWEKLTAIEAAYPDSVIIIHCDENGRQGKARNIAMQYASAHCIGFVDADDWIEPDMYEKMYAKLTAYNCDIVMCGHWRDLGCDDQALPPRLTGQADRIFLIDTVEKRKTFLACCSIGSVTCDKLYTRDLLLQNRIFFLEGLAYEDHIFVLLLYFYATRVYILEERLYHYFMNPSSTVHAAGASHHFDALTADVMMWEECDRRGFTGLYRKELEFRFLMCYLITTRLIVSQRFTQPPYDFFLRLKEETLKRVPDYHTNPYVRDYLTEFDQALLQLLDYPVSEQDLDAVCHSIRKKGEPKHE